ncbi:MAG TPA: hypothetical protein VLD17_01170 [Gemmatimonadaceae bacterium]|jgi:hypothetical protein|nr:hypothetical protein [Gemmatimonadaceae bacterium]
MRPIGLLLALALIAVTACMSDNNGITDPAEIEQALVGTWLQSTIAQGSGASFTLVVTDSLVRGSGRWFVEAGRGGTLSVNGFVSRASVVLDIAEDNGTTLHLQGRLLVPDILTGALTGNGKRVTATFQRQ